MKCYIWNCFVIPGFFLWFFFVISQKIDDAKWNNSISEAKYNESWKSVLPPTLDPSSSTASNQIFNHSEMTISCRRRTPLQFLWSDELNIYRPTVASVAFKGCIFFYSKVGSGRHIRANDVNFNLLTQRFMVSSQHAPYYSSLMQTIRHLIN